MPATRPEFGVALQRARLDAKLTQEELAANSRVSARTISDLERGKARFPHADTVRRLADALGLAGPHLDVFHAAARGRTVTADPAPARAPTRPIPESVNHVYQSRHGYAADGSRHIGIITGGIRRVRHVDIWVNSENTDMKMSRFEEYTISAIVRYDGALRDAVGRVIEDTIADELARNVSGRCPVAAGTTIMTGSGQLAISNNVRAIAHVAAVYGEPGVGYRQIGDVGRCVTSVLTEVDRSRDDLRDVTVLFPMLGTGQGRGNVADTAMVLVGAAADYLIGTPETKMATVWFLAHTSDELAAFQHVLDTSTRFIKAEEYLSPNLAPDELTALGESDLWKFHTRISSSSRHSRRSGTLSSLCSRDIGSCRHRRNMSGCITAPRYGFGSPTERAEPRSLFRALGGRLGGNPRGWTAAGNSGHMASPCSGNLLRWILRAPVGA